MHAFAYLRTTLELMSEGLRFSDTARCDRADHRIGGNGPLHFAQPVCNSGGLNQANFLTPGILSSAVPPPCEPASPFATAPAVAWPAKRSNSGTGRRPELLFSLQPCRTFTSQAGKASGRFKGPGRTIVPRAWLRGAGRVHRGTRGHPPRAIARSRAPASPRPAVRSHGPAPAHWPRS